MNLPTIITLLLVAAAMAGALYLNHKGVGKCSSCKNCTLCDCCAKQKKKLEKREI